MVVLIVEVLEFELRRYQINGSIAQCNSALITCYSAQVKMLESIYLCFVFYFHSYVEPYFFGTLEGHSSRWVTQILAG